MTAAEKRYKALADRYKLLKDYIDVLQKCNKGVAGASLSQDGRTLELAYSYFDANKKIAYDGATCSITLRSASTGIVSVKYTQPKQGSNCTWTFYSDQGAKNELGSFTLKTGEKGADGKKDTSTTLYYDNGAKKAEYSLTGASAGLTIVSSSVTGLNVGVTVYSLALSAMSLGTQGIYATGAVWDTEINMAKTYLSSSRYKEALLDARVEAVKNKIVAIKTVKALTTMKAIFVRMAKILTRLKSPGSGGLQNESSVMDVEGN